MATLKITVEIRSNGSYYETTTRPVRDTPDGGFGCVFGGKVYPLGEAEVKDGEVVWPIEIENEYFEKGQCRSSRDTTALEQASNQLLEEFSATPNFVDWSFEESPNRRYLTVNGSEDQLETLIDLLEDNGITAINWGKSWRPASNGLSYDWFIRLPAGQEESGTENQLRSILSPSHIDAETSLNAAATIQSLDQLGIYLTTDGFQVLFHGEIANLTADLEQAVRSNKSSILNILEAAGMTDTSDESEEHIETAPDELREKIIAQLEQADLPEDFLDTARQQIYSGDTDLQVTEADSTEQIFLHAFHAVANSFSELKNRYEIRLHTLNEKLSEEKENLIAAKSAAQNNHAPSATTDSITNQHINDLKTEINSLREAKEEAEEHWSQSEEKAENLGEQHDDLLAQLTKYKKHFEAFSGSATLIEDILYATTPRIKYLGKSFDVLASMSDPVSALKQILTLNEGGNLSRSKNTQGAPGWSHITISTGSSNDVRLYYNKTASAGVWVWLGYKSQQTRDIRRLPST